jgi:hypothetical protein
MDNITPAAKPIRRIEFFLDQSENFNTKKVPHSAANIAKRENKICCIKNTPYFWVIGLPGYLLFFSALLQLSINL